MKKTETIVCRSCGKDDFVSRNKLFKHLKFCTLSFNPKNIRSIPSIEFNDSFDAYIYVTGGRLRGRTLGSVERFSFRSNRWELCKPMLDNRGSHASASVGNDLYVFGGGGFKSNLAVNEKLDVEKNEWKSVSAMPTSRHAQSVVAVGSDVYCIGGWINGSVCSTDIEKYDTLTDKWEICTQMKIGRRLLGCAAQGDYIYVFGGNIADKLWYTDAVEVYNIKENSWSDGLSLPQVGAASAVTVAGFIYVVIHGKSVYRFDPDSDKVYTLVAEKLPILDWYSFDVCAVNNKIYLVGGAVAGVWSNVMYEYDIFSNAWSKMPDMIHMRRRCAVAEIVLTPISK